MGSGRSRGHSAVYTARAGIRASTLVTIIVPARRRRHGRPGADWRQPVSGIPALPRRTDPFPAGSRRWRLPPIPVSAVPRQPVSGYLGCLAPARPRPSWSPPPPALRGACMRMIPGASDPGRSGMAPSGPRRSQRARGAVRRRSVDNRDQEARRSFLGHPGASVPGRPDHRQDGGPDRRRQRLPPLVDLGQVGINRGGDLGGSVVSGSFRLVPASATRLGRVGQGRGW
jgi:hypothetical protein